MAWSPPTAAPHITSAYGLRLHPIRKVMLLHSGVDLRAATGTPIYAIGDGTVSRSGVDPSAGQHVRIDHDAAHHSRYYHLSSRAVTVGQKVTAGTLIGHAGSTGESAAPHLHLEVRRDGQPLDPIPWLATRGVYLDPDDAPPAPEPEPTTVPEEDDMTVLRIAHTTTGDYYVLNLAAGTRRHLTSTKSLTVHRALGIEEIPDAQPGDFFNDFAVIKGEKLT